MRARGLTLPRGRGRADGVARRRQGVFDANGYHLISRTWGNKRMNVGPLMDAEKR